MNRKIKIFFLIYIVIMAFTLFNTKDYTTLATTLEYVNCGTANKIPKPIPQLTTVAYSLLIVGTPIVLIAFSILTLIKAMASGNADDITKAKNNVIKKFIITAVIFLTAAIVRFVVLRVSNPADKDDKQSVTNCIKCFLYYSGTNCQTNTEANKNKPGYRHTYSNKSLGWNSNKNSNGSNNSSNSNATSNNSNSNTNSNIPSNSNTTSNSSNSNASSNR